MRRAAAFALCVVAALGVVAAARGDDGPRVVVRDEGGAVIADAPLPSDGRFALRYRHSVYNAPAEERFRARAGGFDLVAVGSPSREVLAYYELDGREHRDGRWLVLAPPPARFESLDLVATERGRRTLVVGGRELPLYGERARHLRLTVEGA